MMMIMMMTMTTMMLIGVVVAVFRLVLGLVRGSVVIIMCV